MSRLLAMFPKGPIITDGAWGTELQKRELALGASADLWNLTRPDDVIAVARSYVDAGSHVILTNTFRANAIALSASCTTRQLDEINRQGVFLSRAAANGNARVFASIGPAGKMLSRGEIEVEAVRHAFQAQAEALADAGAEALLLETFSDIAEARIAARACLATGLPVIVSFSFFNGPNLDLTLTGATPEQAALAMCEECVDAIGLNCVAVESAAEICRRLKATSRLPIWIKPNAGLPKLKNGSAVYALSPENFAAHLPAWVATGASFLGGCCGTDPRFVRKLVEAASPGRT